MCTSFIIVYAYCILVDELLVTLLDSKHIELVYAVCGVLVNLMMDRGDSIGVLKDSNGVKK